MGLLFDDAVIIRQSEKEEEPSVITVNCPDKTGLGSDLCRIILFFGLTVVRADVTKVLCELELTIKRVKVSTTPDGKVMDLFFITDTRFCIPYSLVGTVTYKWWVQKLPPVLKDPHFFRCHYQRHVQYRDAREHQDDSAALKCPSISMDNLLSPSHTLVQIVCHDHKGLLYDVMRTLKDYNIQISYGRFTTKGKTECEMDLFIMQADGKKIVDPSKQNALHSRLQMELSRPLRVSLTSRGPDTELLVANPVELSGKGRPLVFYDITLALKMLDKPIFSAEIARYMIGDREWEVYRVLLDEGDDSSVSNKKIEETVWKMLMSWE
ncbi:hypothetical protein DH2020_017974 [Rehmannia glutinosa]|uniref:ACT domain-containing protein ACR n=1 Tax=Rehmannia glutinosa TaxID=99300 RepID=A0ABR0WHK9_REHGL